MTPGRSLSRKHQRPLDGAARQNGALGHDPPQPLPRLVRGAVAADDRRPARSRRRRRRHRHRTRRCAASAARWGGCAVRRRSARPTSCRARRRSRDRRPAGVRPAMKSCSHTMTRAPERAADLRRRQSGGAGADDQHIAERVSLFVVVGVGLCSGAAQTGGRADEGLVDALPERGRPHEGLVVEAGRKKRRQQRIDRQKIEAQRRPAVLARRLKPVEHLGRGRARVRLAPRAATQFDKRIRLFRPGGENAARPVIFETAADQADAVRQQRRAPAYRRQSPRSLGRRNVRAPAATDRSNRR